MKTLLKTWSELYRAFARCAALVATAEENLCCEELCSKILCSVEDETLLVSFPVVYMCKVEITLNSEQCPAASV